MFDTCKMFFEINWIVSKIIFILQVDCAMPKNPGDENFSIFTFVCLSFYLFSLCVCLNFHACLFILLFITLCMCLNIHVCLSFLLFFTLCVCLHLVFFKSEIVSREGYSKELQRIRLDECNLGFWSSNANAIQMTETK